MKVQIHRFILPAAVAVLLISCHSSSGKTETVQKSGSDTLQVQPPATLPEITMPADSGKPYFKVVVYTDNKQSAAFEGSHAIFLNDDNKNASIQMSRSPHLMKIDDYLVLYFKDIQQGRFPIVSSGSEPGKPTLIYTPAKNGEYEVGIGADSGFVTITRYDAKAVSGRFEAYGKDNADNPLVIKAAFLNLTNNNLDQ